MKEADLPTLSGPTGVGASPAAAAPSPPPSHPVMQWLRAQAQATFDTYVPPHVQKRTFTRPTLASLQAFCHRHLHRPAFPLKQVLATYTREDALWDLIGGFTVAVMLVPQVRRTVIFCCPHPHPPTHPTPFLRRRHHPQHQQGMAFSMMATLPPIYGLYTATLPPFCTPSSARPSTCRSGPRGWSPSFFHGRARPCWAWPGKAVAPRRC